MDLFILLFQKRSALYIAESGFCLLAATDRYSIAGALLGDKPFVAKEGVDYLEINCVNDHDLCWKKAKGLLRNVDAMYIVLSEKQCRDLCLSAPFRCHSYDWSSEMLICRLSHHSTRTLTQIEYPFIPFPLARYAPSPLVPRYELGSCQKTPEVGSGGLFWYFIPQVPLSPDKD